MLCSLVIFFHIFSPSYSTDHYHNSFGTNRASIIIIIILLAEWCSRRRRNTYTDPRNNMICWFYSIDGANRRQRTMDDAVLWSRVSAVNFVSHSNNFFAGLLTRDTTRVIFFWLEIDSLLKLSICDPDESRSSHFWVTLKPHSNSQVSHSLKCICINLNFNLFIKVIDLKQLSSILFKWLATSPATKAYKFHYKRIKQCAFNGWLLQ